MLGPVAYHVRHSRQGRQGLAESRPLEDSALSTSRAVFGLVQDWQAEASLYAPFA